MGLIDFGPNHDPNEPRVDWIEGVAIIVAVIIVVMVGSINDLQKDRQFRRLNAKKEDRKVRAIRDGQNTMISIFDVQVKYFF
jgi:Ca2+-transporting ATPase